MSQQTGKVQEAAKTGPRGMEDPMDGSKISSVLFQALKEATRLGQQGTGTKKVLLRAMEAAAKIGQPGEEAGAEERKEAASQGAAKAVPKLKPCSLGYGGCRETHKLDRSRMFCRMTGAQKLAIILMRGYVPSASSKRPSGNVTPRPTLVTKGVACKDAEYTITEICTLP